MKKIKAANLYTPKYVTIVNGGEEVHLSVVEETHWSGITIIQANESDGPYATLSRSIVSDKKGVTEFILDLSEINIPIIRQLVAQGIMTTCGQFAKIYWKEMSWQEIEEAMKDGSIPSEKTEVPL